MIFWLGFDQSNSSDSPLNCYVSNHWKSLCDGLDISNLYILLRSVQ